MILNVSGIIFGAILSVAGWPAACLARVHFGEILSVAGWPAACLARAYFKFFLGQTTTLPRAVQPPSAALLLGSEMAPQVQFLREIRDNTVLQTQSGTSFMTAFNTFYYTFSPAIADYERENPVFKEAVKVGLTPLLTSLTILNYVDIDTEQEMLGYGIGIIMLNIGMYFVAPAVVIIALKNRLR